MKIIYVTPHLSTGGMPEYLRRKVELMLEDNEVWVVEKTFERQYRTIRDKIELLLGDRLITLNGNNETLLKLINDVNPDVVHFEELSDYHFTKDVLDLIYSDTRTYKIFDTLHDSSIDTKEKRFIPDKMLVVSPWQIKNFLDLGIPIEIIEHEIIAGVKDRELGLTKLKLDVDKKHVVQIGLFSRRKNQSETFELARLMPDVQFHFVGNQTENYSDYWKPLLNNKPDNCIIWGERSDAELFYSCMDCVIFTSEGNYGDRETNPLVIREAIAWEVPLFLKDLPVYMGMYNESSKVKFMSNELSNDTKLLYNLLNISENTNTIIKEVGKTAIIISTYPKDKNVIDITAEAINAVKVQGYDVILSSHYPVPIELQSIVNHVIYDANNILTHHDFYSQSYRETDSFKMVMNIATEDNNIYHGPAVYTNYYNGINYAKSLNYDNVICFNFDMIITDENIIPKMINELKYKNAVYNHTVAAEGDIFRTVFFATDVNFFINNFRSISTADDYNKWKVDVLSNSNGLEDLFYHNLVNKLNDIKILNDEEFYGLFNNCKIDICSMTEYFNVLPVTNSDFNMGIWYNSSNLIDDRNINIIVKGNDNIIDNIPMKITNSQFVYRLFNFNGETFTFELHENDKLKKTIIVDNKYYTNLSKNGELIIK